MKKIIVIGSGGHALSCLEVIKQDNRFKFAGFVESDSKIQNRGNDKSIIGSDKDLEKLYENYKYAFIGIGQIRNSEIRKKIYYKLKKIGYILPTIISKYSFVSDKAVIGDSTIIMNFVTVNCNAKIGHNCIINNHSLIEHNASIGSNTHISTNAIINGNVNIGENSFVGSSATIINNISIGKEVIIGSGTIIKKNYPKNSIIK